MCVVCWCVLWDGGMYCNVCVYVRGVCLGCGVKIMDVSAYNGYDAAATTTTNARDAAVSVRDCVDVSMEDVEWKEVVKMRVRVGMKVMVMVKEEDEDEDEGEDAAEAEAEAETRASFVMLMVLVGLMSVVDVV